MIRSATRYSQSPMDEMNSPASRRVRRPFASSRRYADRTPRTPLPSLPPGGTSRSRAVAHFTVGRSGPALTPARPRREPVSRPVLPDLQPKTEARRTKTMTTSRTGHRATDEPDIENTPEMDAEGHSFLLNPSAGREIQRQKEKDLEKQARDHQRQKEAQGR